MKYCPACGNLLIRKLIDGTNKLSCKDETCGFIFWNNPVPVVAALVFCQGQYVLARNAAWPSGIYSLITGYLEQGENPENAVIREVKEELGLDAHVHRFFGNYIFSEKNQLIIAYEVHATGDIILNHELAKIKRLTPNELLQYDFQPLYITEKIIRDWRNHRQD